MTVMLTPMPSEAKPPRMQPLARLPVFLALENRRAVVAGGNAAAAWKAELLSAAGCTVDIYAAEPCEELLALAAEPPRGSIFIHRRAWYVDDVRGAAIAVGACDTDDEAVHFAASARAAGVPVNVIDKPAFCDFSFGAIVNRSPLVIAISTDGAAPVFAQAVRAKLEALIPRGFARWAEAAKLWRRKVQISGLSFDGRRQFWRAFAALAMRHPDEAPQHADYDRLFAETAAGAAIAEQGSVTLVDAGPGDPELLTLRAVRALQSADVILYDDRVSPAVLEFARREAKKMLVGSDQTSLAVGLAQAGRRVVRLVSSDAANAGTDQAGAPASFASRLSTLMISS
jgi:uroporphyrin-III C-methyltransferase/precorrin-2 dehydrogenase/sirohydrochlorin ferrochelatase